MQKDNTQRIYSGIDLDKSMNDQPKDTYRFALNAVNETLEGDKGFLSNEESNKLYLTLPKDFSIVGHAYCGDKETVLLLAHNSKDISEIGMVDYEGNYQTHMNDSGSPEEMKLKFNRLEPLQVVYRLRLGCEKTIYFTGGDNPPRYFNFSKPENFKTRGQWNAKKFALQKTYSRIPLFETPIVNDSGGNLKPGSYNFAVQYLDENLNPTEWVTSSPVVKIYNDLSSKSYQEINGSINSDSDYLKFPRTNKSIEVKLSSLDTDFLYYRLAIISATSGSGEVSEVLFSDVISTSNRTYVYSGTNALTIGTKEEVKQVTEYISSAETIAQIENRLILGNTKGSAVRDCSLQQYASKIYAECVTKEVNLSSLQDASNGKNPTQDFGGLGYMPGEIYSFGIVYVMEDSSTTPVFHIPGRGSHNRPTPTEPNTYLMSQNMNSCESTFYTHNSSGCSSTTWGKDADGVTLDNKEVRHHRFPLRSEIGLPLITETKGQEQTSTFYNVELNIVGELKTPVTCKEEDEGCVEVKQYPFDIRVNYRVENESFFFVESIDPGYYADGETLTYLMDTYQYSQYHGSDKITDIKVEVTDLSGNYKPAEGFDWSVYFVGTPEITTTVENTSSKVQGKVIKSQIMGIKFSNIEQPPSIGGKKVIGYYIVRNERTEFDKSILDSAVLIPTVEYNKYTSHGLLNPDTDKISKSVYSLLHPENKFNDREYTQFDAIVHQGSFKVQESKLGKINYDDVYDGSSYNSKVHKDGNDDGHDKDGSPTSRGFDGWSLNIITRDNILEYKNETSFSISKTNMDTIFYLDALGSRSIKDNSKDVYNISSDNRIGFVTLKEDRNILTKGEIPYVVLLKFQSNPYATFRSMPYYKDSLNPSYFTEGATEPTSTTVFSGDSYIAPMRYTTSTFWDNKVAKRKGKGGFLKVILGAFIAILGAILLAAGGSGALVLGAGIAIMGAGALISSSGLKLENANKVYLQEYDKGLRQTAMDNWVNMFYNYKNNIPFGYKGNGRQGYDGPSDDTIQWIGESFTDLWFESSINISLRNHFATDATPTYLDSPGRIESGNQSPIGTWEFFGFYYTDSNAQRYPMSVLENHMSNKLLTFDPERDDNRYYIGVALGEYYHVNPDYMRKNKEKVFFHLPLEFDCCSECSELFPHRLHYSEQSFQEELSDNYRIFLPNNYRDIQGESGVITNLFSMGSNLYVHTEESLWNMPRNYQERVTDQIVSFIGTGSYFEIPPQKILDMDNGNSAGSTSIWATSKTPAGYFFVSSSQNKVYMFDGQRLKAISDIGMSKWFRHKLVKPNCKAPVNIDNEGYSAIYDPDKERVLLTYYSKDKNKESWTLSYSLMHQSWTSWHSYIPLGYFGVHNKIFSFLGDSVWEHGVKGKFQEFYGKTYPHIIEFISVSNPTITRIWNHISWQTTALQYDEEFEDFTEVRYATFNKAVLYNSRQCSGEMTLVNRDINSLQEDYFEVQTSNMDDNVFMIAKREKDWFLNDLRDIRIDYSQPIWNKSINNTQGFIDKTLNLDSLDYYKDWTELESFRDKYLAVRLIFENSAIKLTTNYTIENEQQSFK